MSEFWSEEIISAYLDDRLSKAQRQQVESYLKSHPQDAETLRDFQQIRSDLRRSRRFALDDDFASRVVAAIKSGATGSELSPPEGKTPAMVTLAVNPSSPWRSAAAAMTALAATLMLVVMISPPRAQNDRNARADENTEHLEDLTGTDIQDQENSGRDDRRLSLKEGQPPNEPVTDPATPRPFPAGADIDRNDHAFSSPQINRPPTLDDSQPSQNWKASTPPSGVTLKQSSEASISDSESPPPADSLSTERESPDQLDKSPPSLGRGGGGRMAQSTVPQQNPPRTHGQSDNPGPPGRAIAQPMMAQRSVQSNRRGIEPEFARIMIVQTAETDLNQAMLRKLINGTDVKLASKSGGERKFFEQQKGLQYRKSDANQFGNRHRRARVRGQQDDQFQDEEQSSDGDQVMERDDPAAADPNNEAQQRNWQPGLLAQQNRGLALVEIEATESQWQTMLQQLGGQQQVLLSSLDLAIAPQSADETQASAAEDGSQDSNAPVPVAGVQSRAGGGFGGGSGQPPTASQPVDAGLGTGLESIKIVSRMTPAPVPILGSRPSAGIPVAGGSEDAVEKETVPSKGAPSSQERVAKGDSAGAVGRSGEIHDLDRIELAQSGQNPMKLEDDPKRSSDRPTAQAPKLADNQKTKLGKSSKDRSTEFRDADPQLLTGESKPGRSLGAKSPVPPAEDDRQFMQIPQQRDEKIASQESQLQNQAAGSQPAPIQSESVTGEMAQRRNRVGSQAAAEVRQRYWLWIQVLPTDPNSTAEPQASGKPAEDAAGGRHRSDADRDRDRDEH